MIDNITRIFIILGILMFAKQAPKLIGDLFGFDASKMGIGIKKKLSEGIPDWAKGTAGGLAAGAGAAGRNFKKAKEDGKSFRNALKSGAGGLVGGTRRGYNASKSAKDWKELKAGMNKGADDAVIAREKRASYKAEHGGTIGAMKGHVEDKLDSAKTFFGGGSPSELLAMANYLKKVSAPMDQMIEKAKQTAEYKRLEEAKKIEIDNLKSSGFEGNDLISRIKNIDDQYKERFKNTIAIETAKELGKSNREMEALLTNFNEEFSKNLTKITELVKDGKILTAPNTRMTTTELTDISNALKTATENIKNGKPAFDKTDVMATTMMEQAINSLNIISKATKKEAAALENFAHIEEQKKADNK